MFELRQETDRECLPGHLSRLRRGTRQHGKTEPVTVRPSPDVEAGDAFECVECGSRVRAPETRTCDDCGGELLNIGAERDL